MDAAMIGINVLVGTHGIRQLIGFLQKHLKQMDTSVNYFGHISLEFPEYAFISGC